MNLPKPLVAMATAIALIGCNSNTPLSSNIQEEIILRKSAGIEVKIKGKEYLIETGKYRTLSHESPITSEYCELFEVQRVVYEITGPILSSGPVINLETHETEGKAYIIGEDYSRVIVLSEMFSNPGVYWVIGSCSFPEAPFPEAPLSPSPDTTPSSPQPSPQEPSSPQPSPQKLLNLKINDESGQSTSAFSPNGDESRDNVNVEIQASGEWTLDVINHPGTFSLQTSSWSGNGAGDKSFTWDGRVNGIVLPDGKHTLRLKAGNQEEVKEIVVDTQAPSIEGLSFTRSAQNDARHIYSTKAEVRDIGLSQIDPESVKVSISRISSREIESHFNQETNTLQHAAELDPETLTSETVVVKVEAADYAGNPAKKEIIPLLLFAEPQFSPGWDGENDWNDISIAANSAWVLKVGTDEIARGSGNAHVQWYSLLNDGYVANGLYSLLLESGTEAVRVGTRVTDSYQEFYALELDHPGDGYAIGWDNPKNPHFGLLGKGDIGSEIRQYLGTRVFKPGEKKPRDPGRAVIWKVGNLAKKYKKHVIDRGEFPAYKNDPLAYWSRAEQIVRFGKDPAMAKHTNIVRGERNTSETDVFLKTDTGEIVFVERVSGEVMSLFKPGFRAGMKESQQIKEAIRYFNSIVRPESRI